MIRAVVFDYGGVFNGPRSLEDLTQFYAQRYHKDPVNCAQVLHYYWDLAKLNKIPPLFLWECIAAYVQAPVSEVREIGLHFFPIQSGTLELAQTLRFGYRVGLLSNNIQDWLEHDLSRYNLRTLFDAIVTSYNMKMAKPDPRMYIEMLRRLQVYPHECAYIDDLPRNLSPARELGMPTVHFQSFPQARYDLQMLGVRV